MPDLTKTFATVNPYLGSDGCRIRLSMYVKKRRRDYFYVVKTSNPSSGEFQDQSD